MKTDETTKSIIDEMLKEKPKPFSFAVRSDWDSLMFWKPMNWRNFTFVYFDIEILSPFKYFELSLCLLGIHFEFDWYRKYD